MVKPDIIQTWYPHGDIVGGIISLKNKITFILREPNNAMLYTKTIRNILRKFIGRYANAIVSNSQGGDLYWQSIKFIGPRYIIPNALPIEGLPAFNRHTLDQLGIEENQKYILYVGRINAIQKNIVTLFLSFLQIVKTYPIKAVICGEGEDLILLKRLIKEHLVSDKIIVPGYIPDVWSLMKTAEVLVSVSHFEGRPNAVIEAMACGCPLIVSDIMPHREILNEENAFFVNKDDVKEIISRINYVLENSELAKNAAIKANKITKEWTIGNITKQYEDVYKATHCRCYL